MNLSETNHLKRPLGLLMVLFAAVQLAVASPSDAAEPFAFRANDIVAVYGNGLADRMQHDPWVEANLQAQLAGKQVRARKWFSLQW